MYRNATDVTDSRFGYFLDERVPLKLEKYYFDNFWVSRNVVGQISDKYALISTATFEWF